MNCPHCDAEVPEDLGWCPECGKRMARNQDDAVENEDAGLRSEIESRVDAKLRELAELHPGEQSFPGLSDAVAKVITQTNTVHQGLNISDVEGLVTIMLDRVRSTTVHRVVCPECFDMVPEEELLPCDKCGEPRLCRVCRRSGIHVCRVCQGRRDAAEPELEIPGPEYSGGFVIAAGRSLRLMDPATLEASVTCDLPHSPRCVACANVMGQPVLLAGWRLGLCQIALDDGSLQCGYCVPGAAVERIYGTPSPHAGSGFNSICASGPDIIATHSELGVWRWSAGVPDSGEPLLAGHVDPAQARHIGPVRSDGQRLLIAMDSAIIIADNERGLDCILKCPDQDILDFRACGERVVGITYPDGNLVCWPIAGGEMRAVRGVTEPTAALVRSEDGGLIAVTRGAALWSLNGNATVAESIGTATVSSSQVELATANGDLLALVTRRGDDHKSRLIMWDIRHQRMLGAEGGAEAVFAGSIRDIAAWCPEI